MVPQKKEIKIKSSAFTRPTDQMNGLNLSQSNVTLPKCDTFMRNSKAKKLPFKWRTFSCLCVCIRVLVAAIPWNFKVNFIYISSNCPPKMNRYSDTVFKYDEKLYWISIDIDGNLALTDNSICVIFTFSYANQKKRVHFQYHTFLLWRSSFCHFISSI